MQHMSPVKFTEEIAKEILLRVASGETIKAICDEEEMPCRSTIYRWSCSNRDFRHALAMARVEQSHFLADEIISIADEELDAQRARNRIEARKWMAGVNNRAIYGNQVDITVTNKPDIKGALSEARNRIITVNAPEAIEDNTQAIDIIDVVDASASDKQSLVQSFMDTIASSKLDDDDIFS